MPIDFKNSTEGSWASTISTARCHHQLFAASACTFYTCSYLCPMWASHLFFSGQMQD